MVGVLVLLQDWIVPVSMTFLNEILVFQMKVSACLTMVLNVPSTGAMPGDGSARRSVC